MTLTAAVQWRETYLSAHKLYCVFIADDEVEAAHAELGGFPVTRLSRIQAVLEPTAAGR